MYTAAAVANLPPTAMVLYTYCKIYTSIVSSAQHYSI